MPATLQPRSTRSAGPFIPPSDIGGGGGSLASGYQPMSSGGQSSVKTNDLPVIASSTPGSSSQMSAQPAPAAVQVAAKPAPLGATTATPNLVSVPSDAYVHVIESGESLYTIARRYDVTAQAIVQANGFSSPDKICRPEDRHSGPPRPARQQGPGPAGDRRRHERRAHPAARLGRAQCQHADPEQGCDPDRYAGEHRLDPAAEQAGRPAAAARHAGARRDDLGQVPLAGVGPRHHRLRQFQGHGHQHRGPRGRRDPRCRKRPGHLRGLGRRGHGNLILVRHPNAATCRPIPTSRIGCRRATWSTAATRSAPPAASQSPPTAPSSSAKRHASRPDAAALS